MTTLLEDILTETRIEEIVKQPPLTDQYLYVIKQLDVYTALQFEVQQQCDVFCKIKEILENNPGTQYLQPPYQVFLDILKKQFIEIYTEVVKSRNGYFCTKRNQEFLITKLDRKNLIKNFTIKILNPRMLQYKMYLDNQMVIPLIEDYIQDCVNRLEKILQAKANYVMNHAETFDNRIMEDFSVLTKMSWMCTRSLDEIREYVGKLHHNNITPAINEIGGNGCSSVHQACFIGDKELLALLIALGGNVGQATRKGYYPVHIIARGNPESSVELLEMVMIHAPHTLHLSDPNNRNALHSAAFFGNTEAVQWLLEYRIVPIDAKTDGQSALHIAVTQGFADIVELLLEAGADPTLQSDILGDTPLSIASNYQHEKILDILHSRTLISPRNRVQKTMSSIQNTLSRSDDDGRESLETFVSSSLGRFSLFEEDSLISTSGENSSENHFSWLMLEDSPCFFNLLAQELNRLYDSTEYSEKFLRQICHQFYIEHQDQVAPWLIEDAELASSNLADKEWEKAVAALKQDYYFISYTKQELELELSIELNQRAAILGRPHIEGRILCHALELSGIRITELSRHPESDELITFHSIVTVDGLRQIDADAHPLGEIATLTFDQPENRHLRPF